MAIASRLRAFLSRRAVREASAREGRVGDGGGKEVRRARKAIASARQQLDRVERHLAVAAALTRDAAMAGDRLDRDQALFDFARTADHARSAIARASARADRSFVAPELLPRDVLEAVGALVPAPMFFRASRSGDEELPVPPELAPVEVVVAWAFMAELSNRVIAPALAAALGDARGDGPRRWRAAGLRLVRGGDAADTSGANTLVASVDPAAAGATARIAARLAIPSPGGACALVFSVEPAGRGLTRSA